ncbi:MAG TPA: ABC transporter permease subunit [Spirochaetia bacterium]|nr:ABC transporter permease subunit [Spirochaetia bacterium]HRZ64556.1 ABC transporter permease subunit [Spirochaetia bacterium]
MVKARDWDRTRRQIRNDWMYYAMFAPVLVFVIIFNYVPMVGVSLAFYKFTPFARKFIGLDNFADLFVGIRAPQFWRAFGNTLFYSITNLVLSTILSVTVALLLNELVSRKAKGLVQTILYLPHFMSWVVVSSIFTLILSPQVGIVNNVLQELGIEPIYFLAQQKWWTPIYFFIVRWKETGWGTIIYLAALSGVNPELYEAAEMDGAGRLRQVFSVTLPAIVTTILIVFILNLGKVMNIFESVFVLQNPNVYNATDVLTTFAYRVGVQQGNYGMGTAIDLFKSFIGLFLVLGTDAINRKIRGSSVL